MKYTKLVVLLVVLVILGVGGFFLYQSGLISDLAGRLVSPAPAQDGAKASGYSAIFLSNGQVYFGKVANSNSQYVTLADVYYLRTAQSIAPGEANKADNVSVEKKTVKEASGSAAVTPQTATQTAQPSSASNLTLVKLGGELHGPTDQLQINRDHVLLIEALREDSKVVKAIADYQQQKPQ